MPKTKCGGCSINKNKKVGLVGKELSHCSDHNEEATGPSASPCYPSCHPRHNVSQRTWPSHSNDAWSLGTSSADAPRTGSYRSDFEAPTNDTKSGGHSEPHQSAGGAGHADLSASAHLHSATCGASAGRRSKIVYFPRLIWRSACMVEESLVHILAVRHSAQALRGSTASVGQNRELFWDVLKLPEHVPPLSAFNIRVKSSTWSAPLLKKSEEASINFDQSGTVDRFWVRFPLPLGHQIRLLPRPGVGVLLQVTFRFDDLRGNHIPAQNAPLFDYSRH